MFQQESSAIIVSDTPFSDTLTEKGLNVKPSIDRNLDLMDQMTEKTTIQVDINGEAICHENFSDLGGTLSPKTPMVGDFPNPDFLKLD